jgi:hypothetical protein
MFPGESSDLGQAIEPGTNKKERKDLYRQLSERPNPDSARDHLSNISSQELVVGKADHPVESRKEVPSFPDDHLHQAIQKNNEIKSIKQFKSTMNCIKEEIDRGNLPYDIKEALIENTRSLLENFWESSDQTESKKRQQSKQERRARIDEFNQRLQKMSRNLPMWNSIGEFIRRYNGESIDEFQARMENVSASASNDLLHTEQLSIHHVLNDIKRAHQRVMDCCQKQDGMDALQSASERLKDSYDKFAILSECSVNWWKIKKNLKMLKKVSEIYDIKQVDYEKVKKARKAYLEMQNSYQQSNGDQERLRITHKDFQEAYCQLEVRQWWRVIKPKAHRNLMSQWWQAIKPENMDLLGPSNRDSREHRPEDETGKNTFSHISGFHFRAVRASQDRLLVRVSKKIDVFDETVQKIKGKIDDSNLPKELKNKTVETTSSLISNFYEFADQVLHCYDDDGGHGWKKYEMGAFHLYDGAQAINKCLEVWKFINEFQASMENTSASSDDRGSLGKDREVQRSASEVLNKLKSEFEWVYKDALDCYSRFSRNYSEYNIMQSEAKDLLGGYSGTIKDKPAYLVRCDMAINEARDEWIAFAKASHAWESIQKEEIGNFSGKNMEEAEKLIESAKANYNALLDPNSCRNAWKSYAEHIEAVYQLLIDRSHKHQSSHRNQKSI